MAEKKESFKIELTVDEFLSNYFDPELTDSRCRACSGYAQTWSCPGFDFSLRDYWKQFSTYTIYVERLYTGDAATAEEAEEKLHREKPVFNKKMLELEKSCGGKAVYAQECEECSRCARLDGKPCRFPGIMRYSIESLGGNAAKLIEDKLGFELLWSQNGSIPEYYLLIGGILQ